MRDLELWGGEGRGKGVGVEVGIVVYAVCVCVCVCVCAGMGGFSSFLLQKLVVRKEGARGGL